MTVALILLVPWLGCVVLYWFMDHINKRFERDLAEQQALLDDLFRIQREMMQRRIDKAWEWPQPAPALDPKIARRIEALRAKAESTEFPEEAKLLRAKADELEQRTARIQEA